MKCEVFDIEEHPSKGSLFAHQAQRPYFITVLTVIVIIA